MAGVLANPHGKALWIGYLYWSTATQPPELGYSVFETIIAQAFPQYALRPISWNAEKLDVELCALLANVHNAASFVSLRRTLDRLGVRSPGQRVPIIGCGPAMLNPGPVLHLLDHVCTSEAEVISALAIVLGNTPRTWVYPKLLVAKNESFINIMPVTSCRYACRFCAVPRHYPTGMQHAPVEELATLADFTDRRPWVFQAASILQYSHFLEMVDIVASQDRTVYVGSMNLNELTAAKAVALRRIGARHTTALWRGDSAPDLVFGLETGSARVWRSMQKPLSQRTVADGLKLIKNARYSSVGFYMITGYWLTDQDDIKETVAFLRETLTAFNGDLRIRLTFAPFLPVLGTPDAVRPARHWEECVAEYDTIAGQLKGICETEMIGSEWYHLLSLVLSRGDTRYHSVVDDLARHDPENIADVRATIDIALSTAGLPCIEDHMAYNNGLHSGERV